PTRQDALFRIGTNDYLKTIGVTLKEGRLFDATDRANTEPVIVINETMANLFWPNGGAIGKRMQVSGGPVWRKIVGVIVDIRERGLEASAKPGMYLPIVQIPEGWAVPQDLAIRAKNPESLTAAARKAVWAVDPDQPISAVQTMDELLSAEVADRRQNMALLAAFAGLALLLASLGIYGVLSYAVTQRTREIGVRMALGAASSEVVRMIIGQGLRLAGAGLLVGAVSALALSRVIASILYGVKPADPVTFGATIAVLLGVSFAACAIPALRASRVDPLIALRDE
ncbi:MAG: FtsX-like permease family protein, partial [Bryobacteraceae bacterium]